MEIKWKISSLDCYPEFSGQANVVSTAHWMCTGSDGEFTGSVYSTCSFQVPEGDISGFTPFDKLTEQQVLQWIWASGVDKEATESAVSKQIEMQKNPPIVQPALPWA
jgi:hypothetical protein